MNSLAANLKNWFYLRFRRAEMDAKIASFRLARESDRIEPGIPADLDGYRTKFARHLIGNWTTYPGYGPFPVTKWRFFADGRAQELYLSVMGDQEMSYLWREAGDFSIELLEVATSDGEDEPEEWFVLNYGFKLVDDHIVLLSLPENADFTFLNYSRDYLHFEGDHPNEEREA